MKIGIVSDTHGNTDILGEIAGRTGTAGHWLHAGDHYADAVFLAKLAQVPVTAVTGNCDYSYPGLPQEEYLEINGAGVWLTHGHRHGVKLGVDGLFRQGKLYGADIIIFGHTHVPYQERRDGILLFNPGSPTYPRGDSPTFGILTVLGKNDIRAEIIKI